MKKEYDFSKAIKGQFYRPLKELDIPVYLDKKNRDFFMKKALKQKIDLNQFVNKILRKEIEVISQLEN